MASNIPSQERVIDPFASYNSNTVNRLTRLISQGNNGLFNPNQVNINITSVISAIVSPGYLIKDDVLIHIKAPHTINFSDSNHYYNETVLPQEGGIHYIVLNYKYEKSKPAPTASICILKPSERHLLTTETNLMFLKAVLVDVFSPHDILEAYDSDPDTVTFPNSKREYIKSYASFEITLPDFNSITDMGRIIYVISENKFYFGTDERWTELESTGVQISLDTSGFGVAKGMLCYYFGLNQARPAQSNSLNTQAEFICTEVGEMGSGRVQLMGLLKDVPVQPGISVYDGDILYLSATTPGTVTNEKPGTYFQRVGKALSSGNSSNPIDMFFIPYEMRTGSGSLRGTIGSSSWTLDGNDYYFDIDVSNINFSGNYTSYICNFFNTSGEQIFPTKIEVRNSGDTLRVVFNVNSLDVHYIIMS